MGGRFRIGPQMEIASRNELSEWDELSPAGLQTENASRIRRSEWDSFSGRSFSGNRIPEFRLRTGRAFLMACLAETTTQYLAPERDTFSGTVPKRKLRPGFDAQNGMPFPAESSSEKRASEFGACDMVDFRSQPNTLS